MDAPVVVEQLHKSFGRTQALDGLDLRMEPGEVHGFLGPNGSGKSTTIRVLLGLLRPDAGRVSLLGGDPWREAAELHRRLAYVPGDVDLWPGLSGGEVIDLLGRLRGGLDPSRRAQLLEDFELDPSRKARTYSKGNRQKVALVAALASDVELYVMDEPTAGLDPLMEQVFQHWVRRLRQDGRTVLLSSHILAEVEALCDRVSIIRAGRTVQSGSLADLRHLTSPAVTAQTDRPADALVQVPGVSDLQLEDGRVQFKVDTDHLQEAVTQLTHLGLRSLQAHPPTLEELFLTQYGDRLPAAENEGDPDSDATGPGWTPAHPVR
ncbi:ABC transporter ATP-binding protein [Ornithinimicrobium flavum]|uniref:ABC transporter ATP-binding protein n=1 Tax=Ornithinimicrobium flavum TaxID=1288636 RepID=UPI00106F4251|nr:ABC transporter ATP-binding protein [Ornithinimicrobium flavum]